jgi:putative hydroxymethylpyrimidine transport system permease protein
MSSYLKSEGSFAIMSVDIVRLIWYLIPPGVIIFLFVIWEIVVSLLNVPVWLLPSPSDILVEGKENYSLLWHHTMVTLKEVMFGFLVALVLGLVLAFCMVFSLVVERTVYPFIVGSQTIPIIAIAPLLLIWVGYGIAPKVIVVALISFFPIVVNTMDGFKSVDSDAIKMMRTFGASRWQIFTKLQMPNSLPYIFTGMKIAIVLSVIGAVIGEWVGASEGLGYLMIRSIPQFQTDRVFAAMFILSALGIILFLSVIGLRRLIIPWHQSERYSP